MLYFSQTQIRVLAFALAITHPLLSRPCLAETQVNTSTKPGAAWRLQSTIILENLPSNNTVQSLDQFGGLASPRTKATGFFHTQLIGQRWWLVTPDGGLFISRGMNSVSQITTPGGRASLKQKFGSSQEWATQTLDLLRNDGFNTLGAWSDTATLKSASKPMAQTILWSFMSSYGKNVGEPDKSPVTLGIRTTAHSSLIRSSNPFAKIMPKNLMANSKTRGLSVTSVITNYHGQEKC